VLFIVLILVLGALGGVVTALITADSLWAWISVALSGLAGLLLVIDWWRRRSGAAEPDAETAAVAEPDGAPRDSAERGVEERDEKDAAGADDDSPATGPEPERSQPEAAHTAVLPAAGELSGPTAAGGEPGGRNEQGLPAEEQTDAADLLIVAELDTEVLVVDEYPRYHLADCGWLEGRDTIPISLAEARELGFTPCARCEPDATLAARHRAARNDSTA
jgi:hypothetical protein